MEENQKPLNGKINSEEHIKIDKNASDSGETTMADVSPAAGEAGQADGAAGSVNAAAVNGSAAVAGGAGANRRLLIVSICFVLILALVAGLAAWQINGMHKKMNIVYQYINENWGEDLSIWESTGVKMNEHPLYDNSAVVKAYKSGNSDGLSDKDAYVLKTASEVIDQIITADMTDYEKELAVYRWLFGYTRYNDSAFSPVSVTVDNATSSVVKEKIDAAGERAAEKAINQDSNADGSTDDNADGNIDENTDGEAEDVAENDPIAEADPYKENYDYEPYGVLKYRQYICVGNATTFQLFMNMLDIPCQIVHSTESGEHAWDLVQIDGDWYHVDITFDNGGSNPAYSYFNVPDSVKNDGSYPWDMTELPAATATKYSYPVMSAENITDIYALPAIIKKTIDDGRGAAYLTFDSSIDVSVAMLDEILNTITSSYYPEDYFYSQEMNFDTEQTYYQLNLSIYENNNTIDPDSSEQYSLDYDRLSNAISNAFGS